ncbi:MAG: hypothetical protein ACJ8F3_00700 [Xanthobacteraceae bacterium]
MLDRRTALGLAASLLLLTAAPVRAADVSPNDVARFIAGMAPAPDSPLAPLTKERAWQDHAKAFDASFERAEQNISRVRAWSSANVTSARPTLFYMFSGPDFFYANAFYPNAKTYVLAGLEPVGTVPDPTSLRGSLANDFGPLRNSLRWLLQHSYFITSQMGSDLRRGRFTGTLSVLYVFLARSGQTIKEVTPVRLDENGALQSEGEGGRRVPARGVKIVFSGKDNEPRTLYYFSTDLSNGGVANSKFLGYLATLAPGDGLVKSASYLLHNPGFSKVREFLLTNAGMMIQDDTGIPLSFYDPQKWDLQPFGIYAGPIPVFRGMYQGKYATLFKHAKPIDFGVGYRWRPNQSNLLLAVRKTGVSTSEKPASSAQQSQ